MTLNYKTITTVLTILAFIGCNTKKNLTTTENFYNQLIIYNKIINYDLRYNKKIKNLMNQQNSNIDLLDTISIYKSDKNYMIIDSLKHINSKLVYNDSNESNLHAMIINQIEKNAIHLSLLRNDNKINKANINDLEKKVIKKINTFESRIKYLDNYYNKNSLINNFIDKYNFNFNRLVDDKYNLKMNQSIEDLKKMGFQTKEEIKNNLNTNNESLNNILQKNIDNQLKSFIPDSIMNKTKKINEYIHEIKSYELSNKDFKNHFSVHVKPFTHRLNHNYNIGFNKSTNNTGIVALDYLLNYNISNLIYSIIGTTNTIEYNSNIRNFNIYNFQSFINAGMGINVSKFSIDIIYHESIKNIKYESTYQPRLLVIGLGSKSKISSKYEYKIHIGYNIINNSDKSPFIFKFGILRSNK